MTTSYFTATASVVGDDGDYYFAEGGFAASDLILSSPPLSLNYLTCL